MRSAQVRLGVCGWAVWTGESFHAACLSEEKISHKQFTVETCSVCVINLVVWFLKRQHCCMLGRLWVTYERWFSLWPFNLRFPSPPFPIRRFLSRLEVLEICSVIFTRLQFVSVVECFLKGPSLLQCRLFDCSSVHEYRPEDSVPAVLRFCSFSSSRSGCYLSEEPEPTGPVCGPAGNTGRHVL